MMMAGLWFLSPAHAVCEQGALGSASKGSSNITIVIPETPVVTYEREKLCAKTHPGNAQFIFEGPGQKNLTPSSDCVFYPSKEDISDPSSRLRGASQAMVVYPSYIH